MYSLRLLEFKDFSRAISFVKTIGDLAEKENHHPIFKVSGKTIQVTYFTHNIDDLSENDFICASKLDDLYFDFL